MNNWSADKTYQVGQKDFSTRIDHVISDKQRLFGRYSRLTRNQFPEVLIFGVQQYNGSGANIDTFLQYRTSVALNDTYSFSPTFVGSFGYGFTRRQNVDTFGSWGTPPPSSWKTGVLNWPTRPPAKRSR